MKVDKIRLLKSLENIVANGVMEGEEVQDTVKNIMDVVWPIIDFNQTHLIAVKRKDLTKILDKYKDKLKVCDIEIEKINQWLNEEPTGDRYSYILNTLNAYMLKKEVYFQFISDLESLLK